MRYLSGFLYALAASHAIPTFLDAAGIGVCVFGGTVALAFAIEAIVKDNR